MKHSWVSTESSKSAFRVVGDLENICCGRHLFKNCLLFICWRGQRL